MFPIHHSLLVSFAVTALSIGAGAGAHAQVLRERDLGANLADTFGWSCANVGDVDGDGTEDFIVGATNYDNGSLVDAGRVVVYSGATGATIRIHDGDVAASLFGWCVAGTGDVDGDGAPDYVVGAPFLDVAGAARAGRATVYSGRTGGVIWTKDGASHSNYFGLSVSGIGDVDGDGEGDVIVGSLNDEIYVLGHFGATIHHLTVASGYEFGYAVAGCDDFDGDGVNDFVVGEPTAGIGPFNNLGAVIAFSGATGVYLYNFFGSNVGDMLGVTLASLGDVDQDGVGDFIAGSPLAGVEAGVIRVVSGASGRTIREQTGDGILERHGESVCRMGDVDGDGVPDYAVGAIHAGGGYEGRVRICSGSDGATIYEWYGAAGLNVDLGSSVAGGDWNGDGVADLLSGDSGFNSAGSCVGALDVLLMCPAWWTNYGSGWAGKNGIPNLVAVQKPVLGASIDLQIGNSLGATTTALLFLGVQTANLPLPGNGTILVTPLVAPMLLLPPLGLTMSSTLPNDPALGFLDLYLQALELDPFATKGISFTPGLQLRLGFDLP